MRYKAFATRTKTDKKEVLVAESDTPIDKEELKKFLQQSSQEYDETSRVRFVTE